MSVYSEHCFMCEDGSLREGYLSNLSVSFTVGGCMQSTR
jgi:hypothetical protein